MSLLLVYIGFISPNRIIFLDFCDSIFSFFFLYSGFIPPVIPWLTYSIPFIACLFRFKVTLTVRPTTLTTLDFYLVFNYFFPYVLFTILDILGILLLLVPFILTSLDLCFVLNNALLNHLFILLFLIRVVSVSVPFILFLKFLGIYSDFF